MRWWRELWLTLVSWIRVVRTDESGLLLPNTTLSDDGSAGTRSPMDATSTAVPHKRPQSVRCWECRGLHCQRGRICRGAFCHVRNILHWNGRVETVKGCSEAGSAGCVNVIFDHNGGVSCLCQDRDFCNAAPVISSSSRILCFVVLTYALLRRVVL